MHTWRKVLVVMVMALIAVSAFSKDTVLVWFAGTDKALTDCVDKLVREFEKRNPDIDVQVEFVPWGELSVKVATSFAGGIGPDIFMHGQAAVAGFVENGVLMPLDDCVEALEDIGDFGEVIEAGRYKGHLYFVPVYGSGRLLAYRSDLFERAGLDPSKPPSTWEQLREYAIKLTEWEGNRMKVAGIDLEVPSQQVWGIFLMSNGGGFFNEEFEPVFNSPQGIEALEYFTELVRKYKVYPEAGLPKVANLDPIVAGTAAMAFVTAETMAAAKKYAPDVYEKIKLSFPPARIKKATFYSFGGFMVSRFTKNREATIKVLSYLTSKSSIAEISHVLGGIPSRKSAVNDPRFGSDPIISLFIEGMKYAFWNPNVPFWTRARDILSQYIERTVRGTMTPKEALDKAVEEIRKLK